MFYFFLRQQGMSHGIDSKPPPPFFWNIFGLFLFLLFQNSKIWAYGKVVIQKERGDKPRCCKKKVSQKSARLQQTNIPTEELKNIWARVSRDILKPSFRFCKP